MTKYLLISFTLFFFISCGGEASIENSEVDGVVNEKYAAGKEVYDKTCVVCHMADGNGLEGTFPPLAKSDYLLKDPKRALKQVLEGSAEEMSVNGVIYNGIMPAQELTDEEAVNVVNYILNAWGNDGGEVSIKDL
ncbi:MAG: cytochrome c [Crocinitomicaceae bacterium]|nr:cytochrome c [Crocinitomicaceae bacterium]